MSIKKRIILAVVVSLFVFVIYQLVNTEEANIDNQSLSDMINSETTVLGALEVMEDVGLNFSISDSCKNMLVKYPEYYNGSMLEVPATDKMVFGANYQDVMNNIEDNGNNIVLLPESTVISISRSVNEDGITMVELVDSEFNYYMMVSDYKFDGVEEGDEIGGFYTPAGTMEFINKNNEDEIGIVGVIALHD